MTEQWQDYRNAIRALLDHGTLVRELEKILALTVEEWLHERETETDHTDDEEEYHNG